MTFDASIIEKEIKDHMDEQPYKIECSECGKELDKNSTIDSDYDLSVVVYPCDCLKGG